jgi:PAS domain S-box-containing protein
VDWIMSQRSALLDALLRSLSRRLLLGLLAMLAIAIGLLGWPLLQHVERTDREQQAAHARQAVAHAATWLAWRRSEQWGGHLAPSLGGPTELTLKPTWLNEALNATQSGSADNAAMERAVRLWVTDDAGRVLAHSDPGDVQPRLPDHPDLRAAWAEWQGARQPLEPSISGDQALLVSHAGVPGSAWVVWRVQPRSGNNASTTVGRLAWTALALLLVCGSVLAAALPRWLRPMARQLHRAMGERARATASRQRLLQTLDTWLRVSHQGVALQRGERFDRVSGSLERMMKLPRQRLQKLPPSALLANEADWLTLQTRARRAFEEAQPYQGEWRLRRADGSVFWARVQGLRVDPTQASSGVLWLFEDVQSDVEEREQRAW